MCCSYAGTSQLELLGEAEAEALQAGGEEDDDEADEEAVELGKAGVEEDDDAEADSEVAIVMCQTKQEHH